MADGNTTTQSLTAEPASEAKSSNGADSKQLGSALDDTLRFWGKAEVLENHKGYKINRLEIKPKHRIKGQIHYHRSEHWVVVSGTAKVICGDNERLLCQNESTYVPQATFHSVENPGTIPLVMIEIQNGEYLGEDDTQRPEDFQG